MELSRGKMENMKRLHSAKTISLFDMNFLPKPDGNEIEDLK